jgi:hypothetical protein
MPKTELSLADRYHDLFRSHPNVYGRTEVTNGFDENGKRNSKSWLDKSELNSAVWENHLSGRMSIGCVPIKPNNMVSWGAIDVDVYQGKFDFEALRTKITQYSLPFVLCRSKSGGGHIYIFLQGEMLAKKMVAKLEEFSAFFGQGSSEIFPKQVTLGSEHNDSDFGNWINMPYDGPNSLRYAQDDSGEALDQEAFLCYAEARKLSSAAFNNLSTPDPSDIFPDGPPCLNYIFSERAQESEMRNLSLSNAAVYLKKANKETWTDELNKVNNLFSEPLPDRELEAIKKSYERKDYRYQCSKSPLCNYCDARKCRQQLYGVGKDEIVPTNRSLTKLNTDPPLWYLTIDDQRIPLNTDQLFNFPQFNKRCLEILNRVFQPYKQSEWLENLASIAQSCTVIDVPEEMTASGQFHEYLDDFLATKGRNDTPEQLLRGNAWETNDHVLFRQKDLKEWLLREKFNELKSNEITSLLRQKYQGEKHTQKIKMTTCSCWKIPKSHFIRHAPSEPLEIETKDAF